MTSSKPKAPDFGPLPPRWRFWQRHKNTLLLYVIRFGAGCLQLLPFVCIAPLAQLLGYAAWLCAWPQRRLAMQQLAHSLPHLPAKQRRRICQRMFVHLARSALELGHLPQLLRNTTLTAASQQCLQQAFAEGRGALLVSAHLGNWELYAQAMAAAGVPVTTVAKPLYDPRLSAWVDGHRRAHGLRIVWRGVAKAAGSLTQVLDANEALALLIDQDTRVDGVFVPFFNKLAHTPSAPAQLALARGVPILLAFGHRDKGMHQVHIERLDVAACTAPTRSPHEAVVAVTAALNARIEAAIAARPEQWVWLHNRWRQRPQAAGSTRATAVAAALLCALSPTWVQAVPAASAAAPAPAVQMRQTLKAPGPVDFRCESLQVARAPAPSVCQGAVVLRKENMLLCCDTLQAQADASGAWQRFVCRGNVRAQHNDAFVWADSAAFDVRDDTLLLTGKPLVSRQQSLLAGTSIRIFLGSERLDVQQPRGTMAQYMAATATTSALGMPKQVFIGPLPQTCPLPSKPSQP